MPPLKTPGRLAHTRQLQPPPRACAAAERTLVAERMAAARAAAGALHEVNTAPTPSKRAAAEAAYRAAAAHSEMLDSRAPDSDLRAAERRRRREGARNRRVGPRAVERMRLRKASEKISPPRAA